MAAGLSKNKKQTKKKQPSFFKRFAKDFEDIATGLPAGLYRQADAAGKLLQAHPKPMARLLRDVAKGTYADMRHPLRHPGNTLLTALGIASGVGGGISRTAAGAGAISRGAGVRGAVSAAARKPTPTRKFTGIPDRPGQFPKQYEVPANPNPLVRGARKVTLDPMYRASARRAAADRKKNFDKTVKPKTKERAAAGKEVTRLRGERARLREKGMSAETLKGSLDPDIADARRGLREKTKEVRRAEKDATKTRKGKYAQMVEGRTRDQQTRYTKQAREGREVKEFPAKSGAQELWHGPMNLLRMSMYLRPRYFAQNLGGTLGLLGMQQPLGLGKSAVQAHKLRKSDREGYDSLRGAMGESGASSIGMGTTGKLSGVTQEAARLANIPESHLRVLAILKEGRNEGLNPSQLVDLIRNAPESQKALRVMQRANEAVVDYSRLGPTERAFMRSGVPIFYPMTKNFARYGAQFPTHHSTLAAYFGQLGQEGRAEQVEGFGGYEPPPWSPYVIPTGDNKLLNPQNVYQFSPGADLARQFFAPLDEPTLSLATNIGPGPELAYALATGRQLPTGFRMPDLESDADWDERMLAALSDHGQGTIPGMDYAALLGLVEPRVGKAYEDPTTLEQLAMILAGPAYSKRRYKPSVMKEQGRRRTAPLKARR